MRLILCAGTIAIGLGLRRFGYDAGLSFVMVKYGGSLLWGTMVFFFTGIALPTKRLFVIATTATAIAIIVELSRLCHTPALDAFRLTSAGALLLGRVFSLWNIIAYVGGIALGCSFDIMAGNADIRVRTSSCRSDGSV